LDDAEGMDERERNALAADLEVFQRALRLRTPIFVGGDVDRSEAVGFGARGGHSSLRRPAPRAFHFFRNLSRLTIVLPSGAAFSGAGGGLSEGFAAGSTFAGTGASSLT